MNKAEVLSELSDRYKYKIMGMHNGDRPRYTGRCMSVICTLQFILKYMEIELDVQDNDSRDADELWGQFLDKHDDVNYQLNMLKEAYRLIVADCCTTACEQMLDKIFQTECYDKLADAFGISFK